MSHTPNQASTRSAIPWQAAIGALGVVYGDIGTSPLYAFRECFGGTREVAASAANLIGAASLITWSLLFIVSFKYLQIILKLDNRGEGGVLALAALIRSALPDSRRQRWFFGLGLFGAALIYADGMLTPSMTVLSAVEGLKEVIPGLGAGGEANAMTIPGIAVCILIGLFSIQRLGTGKVGSAFGPVVLLWFLVIALVGAVSLAKTPAVLLSLSPHTAFLFLIREWRHGMPLLAAVFLAVTGGEALYADLGHFGRRPIRLGWFSVVLPALVLNYLGQAALITRDPSAVRSPFFLLVPNAYALPLTILATLAAIIASQALISGAFSLTAQAIQLGCLPRLRILHTSTTEKGQIYLPLVNVLLSIACILLVVFFRTSESLAAAYGIAIALTMTVTSLLFWVAAREIWKWNRHKALALTVAFLVVDLSFLGSNGVKLVHGGMLPLVMAMIVVFVMTTWTWGRVRSARQLERQKIPLSTLLDQVARGAIQRVRGTAIFMTGRSDAVPIPLLHNLKHNGVLHETLILLHVITLDVPTAHADERIEVAELGHGFHSVLLRFGFSEEPDVPKALKEGLPPQLAYHPGRTSFFLGRETILTGKTSTFLQRIRLSIFASMLRNATPASSYFRLPPNRVVELGAQVIL